MDAQAPLWWQTAIIYQIYPRSFQDSNGDGVGDLAGIVDRLDYLRQLGITAIWLSPFYPSPMADFGYDVSNYVDVDPIFGTLADFDRMTARAHDLGMQVIVDFVPNHTSDRHPWFLESRSSRDNPRRDWYVWRDAREDGSPPNNWFSQFGGPAWTWDGATQQYYLHSFLKEQPDVNWRNPEARAAMLDVLRFWLERGVDGFRIDVAHYILKDPDLRDNPANPNPPPPGKGVNPEQASQLPIYSKAHADVHEAFREIRQVLDRYSGTHPRMAVGEIYESDWPVWASYYGQLDELHMPFNFALLGVPWTAEEVRAVVDSVEAHVPPGGWPNYVLGNHDRPRVATRVGAAQAPVAMLLLLTLRGTPTIYYGDEIGMHNVPIAPEQVQDPYERNMPGLGLGRDPVRTPMQWDPGPNAGFCPPDATPWLPLADDYRERNVEVEQGDPSSMLALTRALIRLRQGSEALLWGGYRPVDNAPDGCFVYLREAGDERLLIALNLLDQERMLEAPDLGSGEVLLTTDLQPERQVALGSLTLRPNQGMVVRLM